MRSCFSTGGGPRGDSDRINQHEDNNGGFHPSVKRFLWPPGTVYVNLDLCALVFPETTAEVGTIAGIMSAVAVALVGAISSYISYQKKKLCFSIQREYPAEAVTLLLQY